MFRYKSIFLLSSFLLFLSVGSLFARENIGFVGKTDEAAKTASDCAGSVGFAELNINNVRTRINVGGDMWWDASSNNTYEIPKVEPGSGLTPKHSLFAGAIWIGGFDALGQLKIAAHTYRQSGNDFYPGPLDALGEVEAATCESFDRFWEVRGVDISEFIATFEAQGTISESDVPESILKWPGKNNQFFDAFAEFPVNKDLAPFWDEDQDGEYNPLQGDYPVIDSEIEGVFADQMLWWVYNDKGNAHSETQGEAIGIEIRGMAFAFATNDEVNNMTFYKYVIENNSSISLDSTFIAQWVDPDLGEYQDDFVGCDTINNMGIVYNGDADDEGEAGYGDNPPMLGVDFFKGPNKPILDENGKQVVGPNGEPEFIELGMSSFLYYDNDFTTTGNPQTASHHYGYLSGTWKDGSPFTFGGNGYGGTEPFNFMFPDDPANSSGWSECAAMNIPADRRFLQSAGPFRLDPGVVNDVIVGVIWVPEAGGCPGVTFDKLPNADKKAQALFDNNFKLIDGPDAPNMTIRELDQQLIISLWNSESSNNFNESFADPDPVLASIGKPDSLYTFEGYRIFQLANSSVSPAEFGDPNLAREIFTVDVKNGVSRILNFVEDPALGEGSFPQLMVESPDEGITHTFVVTSDQFGSQGVNSLVNHKRYYFSALAYSYNNYTPYDPLAPFADDNAQQVAYLAGRKNVRSYTAIPHDINYQYGAVQLGSSYGDSPDVTQIEGFGNGCNDLELTEESVNRILTSDTFTADNLVYQGGRTPINVQVFDPVRVPAHKFRLTIKNAVYTKIPERTDKGGLLNVLEDGSIEYTSPFNNTFFDYDHFNYTITSPNCLDEIASVVINVEASPIKYPGSFDDTRMVESGSSVTIPVLENDVLRDAKIIFNSQPSSGTVVLSEEIFTYTPNANFFGTDVFSYTVEDSLNSTEISLTTAKVYINVIDPNDPVEFEAVDDIVSASAGGVTVIRPLDNDVSGGLTGGYRIGTSAIWELEDFDDDSDTIYTSLGTIKRGSDQAIGGWEGSESLGFTVSVTQAINALEGDARIDGYFDGVANVSQQWLGVISDGESGENTNWILSGAQEEVQPIDYTYDLNEYYEGILEGGVAPSCLVNGNTNYNAMNSVLPMAPGCGSCYQVNSSIFGAPPNTLDELRSIDVVYTSNKDLWTRSVVVEMSREAALAQGGGIKNSLRRHPSWDKEGDGSYAQPSEVTELDSQGSYFVSGKPNAFVSVEVEYDSFRDTLEIVRDSGDDTTRYVVNSPITQTVSIDFPLNSFISIQDYITLNDDFLFTDEEDAIVEIDGMDVVIERFVKENLLDFRITSTVIGEGTELYDASDIGRSWFPGYAIDLETGKRLNIMFGENSFIQSENGADMIWNPTDLLTRPGVGFENPASRYLMAGEHYIYVMNSVYDEGAKYHDLMIKTESGGNPKEFLASVYNDGMWTICPKMETGFSYTSVADGLIPNDLSMKVRVKVPYTAEQQWGDVVYEFDMSSYAPVAIEEVDNEDILALSNVVPNPYYAFSAYENSKLDNRIKITNLPPRATVRIFTLDGTLVRQLEVDNSGVDTGLSSNNSSSDIGTVENAIDWDLKNFKNVPIASGMYIIHIEDRESGAEKTLKWFGVIRPVDLDTF